MKPIHLCFLLALAGCERETTNERPDPIRGRATSINDRAPIYCRTEGARRHTLYLMVESATPPAEIKVRLTHQSPDGLSGNVVAMGMDAMPLNTFAWVSQEHAEGRRPWLEGIFCTPPNSAAGIALEIKLASYGPNANQRIVIGGGRGVTTLSSPLVRVRLVDENPDGLPLEPVTFQTELPSGGIGTWSLLHVGGTRPFCPLGQTQLLAGGCGAGELPTPN